MAETAGEMAASGFPLLPIAPPVSTLTSLPVQPSDVFVASWPKSGANPLSASPPLSLLLLLAAGRGG